MLRLHTFSSAVPFPETYAGQAEKNHRYFTVHSNFIGFIFAILQAINHLTQ